MKLNINTAETKIWSFQGNLRWGRGGGKGGGSVIISYTAGEWRNCEKQQKDLRGVLFFSLTCSQLEILFDFRWTVPVFCAVTGPLMLAAVVPAAAAAAAAAPVTVGATGSWFTTTKRKSVEKRREEKRREEKRREGLTYCDDLGQAGFAEVLYRLL